MADYSDNNLRHAGRPRQAPAWLTGLFVALIILGAVALLAGVNGSEPQRAWQAYLVNLVFWTGLAAGSLLFSVILTLTHAHWGRALKRLAESVSSFLPVSLLLLAGLYPGRRLLFSWIEHPLPEKAAWLNGDFLFVRDEIGLLLLTLTGVALLYLSLRRDQRFLAGTGDPVNAQGDEERAVVFANIYGILYFLVLSLLAFDLIMSLDPTWYSTLFGAYYLVSAFYTALALLFILALLAVRYLGLSAFITPTHFQKLGKLMLGFCLMTGDFFYTQFLVMWYGNLPEETGYLIKRIRFEPWHTLSWVVLCAGFIIPFALLLSSRIKRKFPAMLALCGLIVVGMWLERFLLVAPSVWLGSELPLGLSELAITGGFLGLMGLCVTTFLGFFPVLPVADPLFRHHLELAAHEEER